MKGKSNKFYIIIKIFTSTGFVKEEISWKRAAAQVAQNAKIVHFQP